MANERVVNNQKITDMLQKMLQLGGTFIVDINKQVHYSTSPDEPICIGEGKVKKCLYIYDTNIQDPAACILNPLSETSVISPDQIVLYHSLSSITSQWLSRIMTNIIDQCVILKEDKNATVDPTVVSYLTPFISKVDDKLIAEMERLRGAGHKSFANIYYNRTKKTSTLLMGLEDETNDYQKQFTSSQIRKKSWGIFNDIVRFILKVPDGVKIKEHYSCSTEKIECPRFSTFTDVWIRIWECIDPYLDWIDNHHSDPETIESLKEHFKNIPVYRECVTWLKQPIINSKTLVAPNTTTTAGGVVVPTTQPEVKEPSWKITNTNPGNIVQVAPAKPQPSWMVTSNSNMVPGCNYGMNNNNYNRYSYGNIVRVRSW